MALTPTWPCLPWPVDADLWREDLCLEAAEIIERGSERPTPIDPVE